MIMDNNLKMEKFRNLITVLLIAVTLVCCIVPFFTNGKLSQTSMISAFGEEIQFYGKGIYARNSFSMGTQAVAQDMITLFLVVPCTIISLIFVKKNKTIAEFVLTGMHAYLLYTFMSYAFLMFYNELFLLYVGGMVLSFYGLIICINLLSRNSVIEMLQENMKTKGLRVFLVITGIVIALMWLGRIAPTIVNGQAPEGLDNCSTLGIQVLDLGVIVPACFVISYLLRIKSKLGYVLGPVIIIKAVTLVMAVLAMALQMTLSGVYVAPVEYIAFGIICIISLYFLCRILKQIRHIEKEMS